MVKEGIQTRRRKQKNCNGNLTSKSKYYKHTNVTIPEKEIKACTSEQNQNYIITTTQEEYLPQENYQCEDFYPQHMCLLHHTHSSPFEQNQRFSSQQQLEMTTSDFDNESRARKIVASPLLSTDSSTMINITNNEIQHLNAISNTNNNQP